MITATITAKGQITIPFEVRNALKLDKGDLIAFEETAPGIISIVELCWVLESAFDLSRAQIVEVLQYLAAVEVFKIDRVSIVAAAVRAYSDGKAGLADYLIERLSAQAGCEQTMTFDKAAAKSAGMILIE